MRRLYLSEEGETIIADLVFAYGDYEVPMDTAWPETATRYDEDRDVLISIRRRREEEEAAWRAMSGYGLKRDGERFVLRRKVSPRRFSVALGAADCRRQATRYMVRRR